MKNSQEEIKASPNKPQSLQRCSSSQQSMNQSLNLLEEHQKRMQSLQQENQSDRQSKQNYPQISVNLQKVKVKSQKVQSPVLFVETSQKNKFANISKYKDNTPLIGKSNTQNFDEFAKKSAQAVKSNQKSWQFKVSSPSKLDKQIKAERVQVLVKKSTTEINLKDLQTKQIKPIQIQIKPREDNSKLTQVKGQQIIQIKLQESNQQQEQLEEKEKQDQDQITEKNVQVNENQDEPLIESSKLTKANDISKKELSKYQKNKKSQQAIQIQKVQVQLENSQTINLFQTQNYLEDSEGIKQVRFNPVVEIIELSQKIQFKKVKSSSKPLPLKSILKNPTPFKMQCRSVSPTKRSRVRSKTLFGFTARAMPEKL